jgi:branched-chain amino acid transport system ATP-binding protein
LLRSIFGFAPIVGGTVEVFGQDVTGASAARLIECGVVLIPQERSIFPEMTVYENLQMGAWASKKGRAWCKSRIEQMCDEFPTVKDSLHKRGGNLSGGQQKLVEIVRGLIMDPKMLVLDEPTAGLSPGKSKQIYEEIGNLNRRLGVTVLLVDQNVRDSLALGHHAYVLELGKNAGDGPTSSFLNGLDNLVRGWMGNHSPNGKNLQ